MLICFFLIIRNSFYFQFHSYIHLVCFCVTKQIHSFKKNAANKTNQYFTSIKLLLILLIFLLPTFCEGIGQQLEIKLPHFTAFHHLHHTAWVKFEVISFKILNAINSSSLCRPTASLFPFALASISCLGRFL